MALDPMKFFRKHNKKLLAVFMALLLVVWLGGSALESMLSPNPQSRVVATTRYGELRGGDHAHALRVTNILERLRLPWSAPAGFSSGQTEPLSLFEWMVLTREAVALGFEPKPEEAEEYLLNARRIGADYVNQLANQLDAAPGHIYAAVSEFQSVARAAQAVGFASPISEAEVRVAARNVLEKVKVQLVALPAKSFVDEEATFSDAELEELFTKYREQEPGRGMTFGYFLPPRLKAQYIKLDVGKVEAGLRESEVSLERKARVYWREHRFDDPAFLLPPPTPPAEADPEPTTQEADQEPPTADDQAADADKPEESADAGEPGSEAAGTAVEGSATDGLGAAESPEQAEPANSPGSAEAEPDQPTEEPPESQDPQQAQEPPDGSADEPAPREPAPDGPAADEAAPDEPGPEAPAADESGPDQPAPGQAAPGQPAPDEPPPGEPASDKPELKYFQTYPEAREAALAVVRRQAALAEANRIAEYVGQRVADPWYDVEQGPDGYKVLPPPVENLKVDEPDYYDSVIAGIPAELRFEGALTTATTDWFTHEEASAIPGLGIAAMETREGGPQTFAQFGFRVQGLAEIPKRGKVDQALFLAQYQSSVQWLTDGEGNRYLYRIIGVEPARAPESLDQVRDQVVEDLRLQRAYEEAQQEADALLAEAKEVGLRAAWDARTELQEIVGEEGGYKSAEPFARERLQMFADFSFPVSVQGVGLVDDAFLERCFELGPASAGRERYAVIPAPDLAKTVVVEWESTEPVRQDAYARERQNLIRQLRGIRQVRLISEWLNPELIRSRNGFKFPEPDRG